MTHSPAPLNERARRPAHSGTHLARSTRGRLSWDLNDAARFSSGGARRRPTDSEAVNGYRAARAEARCMMGRNSPQPSHNFTGDIANVLELADPLPAAQLGSATVQKPSALPLSFKTQHNTHEVSPVLNVALENMEKSVRSVCNEDLPNAEIEKARETHQRLIVRMMTSPGDSTGAMYRLETAFGLSFHCQKNLRHQHRASGEFIARLHAAWLSVLEASVKRDVAELLAEREKTEAA